MSNERQSKSNRRGVNHNCRNLYHWPCAFNILQMKISDKQKPYLIGAGIALLLLFILRKKGNAAAEQQSLQQEASQQGQTTYPQSQFFAWANRLEQSMFDWGTDEETIFEIFSMLNNNADFLALKRAFGVRNYTGGILPGFVSGDLTLDGWLQEELDNSEINEINSILSRKGISYKI